jgi:hypothetical protein
MTRRSTGLDYCSAAVALMLTSPDGQPVLPDADELTASDVTSTRADQEPLFEANDRSEP